MYIIIQLVFVSLLLFLLYFFYRSYKFKSTKRLSIYKWMKLRKENRNNLESKEKNNTLRRKTRLIKKTRSEYLKLYKK